MFNLSLPSLHVFCAEPKPRAMPLPMAVAKATLAMCMHKYCISIRTVLLNLVRLGFPSSFRTYAPFEARSSIMSPNPENPSWPTLRPASSFAKLSFFSRHQPCPQRSPNSIPAMNVSPAPVELIPG